MIPRTKDYVIERAWYLPAETAELAGCNTSSLRFWETELQIPIPRYSGNTRKYSPRLVQLFLRINHLHRTGMYTLKGIRILIQVEFMDIFRRQIHAERRLKMVNTEKMKLIMEAVQYRQGEGAWDELLKTLKPLCPIIREDGKKYSFSLLVDLIDQVRRGDVDTLSLPRDAGIRAAASQLLLEEQAL